MAVIMTIKSHCVEGTKANLAQINPKWNNFWQSSRLQALHLCFKCKIKETVYSSAGYRASNLHHCLAAWMSWQLALVLMVSFLPTNEYRQGFKAIFKSSNMTQVLTFQDFADTDGTEETENYEESRKIDPPGKVHWSGKNINAWSHKEIKWNLSQLLTCRFYVINSV